MSATEDGGEGEDDERNPTRLWPAVINYINSHATYYRESAKSRDDPYAKKVAKYTKVTGIGTAFGAGLAGIAAFVFWLQLGAMQRANDDNLKAFLASQRAYVVVDRFDFWPDKLPDGTFQGWIGAPIIENTGRFYSGLNVDNSGAVPTDPEFWYQQMNTGVLKASKFYYLYLGPRGAVTTLGGAGIPETYPTNTSRKTPDRSSWSGSIHYNDTLPGTPERITEFCYTFADNGPARAGRTAGHQG